MSDVSQGPGWWLASDGKWYPPEAQPGPAPTPTAGAAETTAAAGATATATATDVGERTASFQVAPEQVMPATTAAAEPATTTEWSPAPAEPSSVLVTVAPAVSEFAPAEPISTPATGRAAQVKAIGGWVIVLGLAIVLWGVGLLLPAIHQLKTTSQYASLTRYGDLVAAVGVLIMGLVVVVIGSLIRKD